MDDNFKFLDNLNGTIDQLVLFVSKKKKYTTATILQAFNIYLYSATAYEIIRNNNILILPHKSTLKRISANLNINAENQKSNLNYLNTVVENLNPVEKYINLQVDEIYIKNYKTIVRKTSLDMLII